MPKWLLLLFFFASPLAATEQVEFCGEIRVNLIKGWDKLLTWTLSAKIKPYQLSNPLMQEVYERKDPYLQNFVRDYGFYSTQEPIVGVVTEEKSHIQIVNTAMQELSAIDNAAERSFARDELLTKVLAYRVLKKGMEIAMPGGQKYLVDQVFDLWHGMPAFGLIPQKKSREPPILLFRGTDMDLISENGWASILSDLDTTGPGHGTFLHAQKEIHLWLEKVKKAFRPARALGYSLGGAFVFYTLIYESQLLNQHVPSIAFNPPGISKTVLEKWERLSTKIPLKTYVNQGDIVSQIGFLLSDVWELSLEKPMDVIEAHLTLIAAEPYYKLRAVDVVKENQARLGN